MGDSITGSLSVGMSKKSLDEDIFDHLPDGHVIPPQEDSISNEEITKGISLSETYTVISDPIRGGMGSVWKVHHSGWNMDLAMKRPLPKFFAESGERRKENFVRECEDWIDLGLHPNIVSCYYVRDVGGVPTIFSEWMENGSLESRIQDKTLYSGTETAVRERLLDIAIQFARGLHYAHESEKGLIHQDVKPDNLLLTLDWDAKVADFGLARARSRLEDAAAGAQAPVDGAAGAQSPADAAAGAESPASGAAFAPVVRPSGYTPAYCSFEQAAGKPVSRRTDIYSWALSVMEMYMGSRPWKSGTEAGRRFEEYCEEESFRVKMPEGMKALLSQCLAEDPDERPQDFGGIIEKLTGIYRETTGTDYPRPEPDAAPDTADSLNNRALSYLDLGKSEEAGDLWEKALKKDAAQADAVFNRALFLRRSGRVSYSEAEELLASIEDYRLRDSDLDALKQERRILDLDLGDFSGFKGKNFTSFSGDRSRGAGLLAVRGSTGAVTATHIVADIRSGRTLFTDPAEAMDYRNERTLLTSDGRSVLVNRYGNRYRGHGAYGEDAFYEVDTGREIWRRQNLGEMFMLSPDDRFAVGNRIVKEQGEYDKVEVVVLSLESGEILRVLTGMGGLAGFTPDGRMLLSGKLYTSMIDYVGRDEFLAVGGTPDGPVPDAPVRFEGVAARALSERCWIPMKDGRAVFCGDTAVKILDPLKGTADGSFEFGEGIYGKLDFAALLDDETLLLGIRTYRGEQTALLWDLGTGELVDRRELGRIMDPRNVAWMVRSPAPVILRPSVPADYKLSLARGLRDRVETQNKYRELLKRAQEAFEAGEPIQAGRFAMEASALPGCCSLDEPYRLQEAYGKGLNKFQIIRFQMTEEAAEEKARRPLPDEEDAKRFAPGLKAIRKKLREEHEENIDTEVFVYARLGEYCKDRGRIIVYTEVTEDDISPFRPQSARYTWYGAGVLDAESGEPVYLDGNLYYRGNIETNREFHHHAVLDHSGGRLLEYSTKLTVRGISGDLSGGRTSSGGASGGGAAGSGAPGAGTSSTGRPGESDVRELASGEFLYADFMDDDRYVLCMDIDNCARIIDTVTGKTKFKQVFPNTEYGTLFCLDGESFGIPHYGRGFLCRIVWDYYRTRSADRPQGMPAADARDHKQPQGVPAAGARDHKQPQSVPAAGALPKRVRAAVILARTATRPVLAEKVNPGTLDNAIKAYAPGVKREEIIAIEDITFFRSGKKGFLYTGSAFYSSFLPDTGGIRYEDIDRVQIEMADRLSIRLRNGRTVSLELGKYQESVLHMLRTILMT